MIPVFRKGKLSDHNFHASLDYLVRICPNEKETTDKKSTFLAFK